jgi:protease-4
LFKTWGINTQSIQRGDNAGIFSISKKFSDSERKIIKKIISDFYLNFVQRVAENRKMTNAEINEIAQGRVWQGIDGYQNGLIDTLGGLHTAIELAKKMVGIEKETDPEIIVYPRKKSVISKVLRNLIMANNSKDYILVEKAKSFIRNFELQPLALMPYEIYIH